MSLSCSAGRMVRACAHACTGAAAAFALLAGGASAAQARDSRPAFRATIDGWTLLAGGKGVGETRTLSAGDELTSTGIGYSAVARLSAPLNITLAGVPVTISPGELLLEARGNRNTRASVGGDAVRIFCDAPRIPATSPVRSSEEDGPRYDESVMPCVADSNGDGQLDIAFLTGTRWDADRIVVPLTPVPFEMQENMPLPRSSFRVTYERGGLLSGPVLRFHVLLLGRVHTLAAVELGTGRTKRRFPVDRGVFRRSYPMTAEIGAARFTVLGYHHGNNTIEVRTESGFENARMKFEYPSNTIYIYY